MYRTFSRTWWKRNMAWPGGREPHIGRKTLYSTHATEEAAWNECREYNNTHKPGFLSRKMEYEAV